jgi:RimJ/RimL family protein N-acetyltransferase
MHPMTLMPTIETERLTLRAHHVDDFDSFVALWAHPDVSLYVGGQPPTREEVWQKLMQRTGMWHHMGFGFLALEEKASGRLVGEAGFHEARRPLTPSLEGTLETGWMVSPDHWGRGYASEAVAALIAWGEQTFPAMDMSAIIHPDNGASLAVARKAGFFEIARAEYKGPCVVLLRPRSEDAA